GVRRAGSGQQHHRPLRPQQGANVRRRRQGHSRDAGFPGGAPLQRHLPAPGPPRDRRRCRRHSRLRA
ncbi:unnamed protein product, partial [Ectocarpus fasciculatus]